MVEAAVVENVNVAEKFVKFLKSFKDEKGEYKYRQRIARMALEGSQSLVVDFDDVLLFDAALAEQLIEQPRQALKLASEALREVMKVENAEYASLVTEFFVRIRKIPDKYRIPIRRLRSVNLGKLIAVEGVVTKISPIKQLLVEAVFKCKECGEEVGVPQSGSGVRRPPFCPSCSVQGREARHKRSEFELVAEKSEFIDWQKFVLQERPEDLPSGQLPRSIEVVTPHDLVDVARPGDRAVVTGLLTIAPERGEGQLPIFQMYLEANYIEVTAKEAYDIEITPEDEKKILELSRRNDIREMIVNSIAPSIYGYREVKSAIALLLFRGIPKTYPDGVRVRGDVHILLIGDPGTAKSQLLRYVASLAPRGIYTSGKGSTAAGLTAAVVREKASGDFYLEAGALVLADGGVACLHPSSPVATPQGEVEIERLYDPAKAFAAASRGQLVEISPLSVEVRSFTGTSMSGARATLVRRKRWCGNLIELKLEGGRSVSVTLDHLLFDAERWEWVPAGTLSPGRYVVIDGGDGARRAMVTAARLERHEGYVYDLFVPVHHNFASNGIVVHNCIDEFDKMDPRDRVSIHEAMEQQTISIAKAGIVATLNARASILAAANPAFGRYLHGRPITENIDLPPTILSRFDLIFVITDVPDQERDRQLADHVLNFHRQSYPESIEHVIPRDLLKKYIAYARKYVRPRLTEEAKSALARFYTEMRSRSQGVESPITITPRQLEALIRLTEAHARMALSDTVTGRDAEAVIELMMHFLKSVGYDVETGRIDIDIVMTGQPKSQRDKILIVMDLLRTMMKEAGGEAVKRDEVVERALERGLDEQFVEKVLEKLYESGEIIEPRPGYIMLLRSR